MRYKGATLHLMVRLLYLLFTRYVAIIGVKQVGVATYSAESFEELSPYLWVESEDSVVLRGKIKL